MGLSINIYPHGKVDQFGYSFTRVVASYEQLGVTHFVEDYYTYHKSDDFLSVNEKLKACKADVISSLCKQLVYSEVL